MINAILTKKLNNGVEVLAKMYAGEPSAMTYANRTQAQKKASSLGDPWRVYNWGRPFYVGKGPTVMERFAEADGTFRDYVDGLAAVHGKSVEQVYRWWLEYAERCDNCDQSPVLFEFEQWYAEKLACTCHPMAVDGKGVLHHVDCGFKGGA